MKSKPPHPASDFAHSEALMTELLILADGRVFVQNLTQPMAELLSQLNPEDQTLKRRGLRRPCHKP